MSQVTSLQCLFCQYFNSADAVFCDDCGGQLNLQPCNQCDAVDSRTAKNCYKCGAEFSLPVAPGSDFPLASAVVDKELSYPTSIDIGVAGPEASPFNQGLVYLHPESPPVDEVLSPETSARATKSRRSAPFAILALLLLLITAAASMYLYRGQPAQAARAQGQKQAVTDVPDAPKLGETAPPTETIGKDTTLRSVDTVQKPTAGMNEPGKMPSLTPSGVEATLAARPLPSTEPQTKTLQDPLVVEKCPPAVATLGLCNPDTQQEKP